MTNETLHDAATSNVLAWSSQSAHMQHEPDEEVAAEADEPPDDRKHAHAQSEFKRTIVRKTSDHPQSLLTKALHQSDEELPLDFVTLPSRRRSMNSNVSFASTADLTSDTGLTSPARTSTPSPPPPVIRLGRFDMDFEARPKIGNGSMHMDLETTPTKKTVDACTESRPKDPAVEVLAKKRCITFACGPKPEAKKVTPTPQASLPKLVTNGAISEKPAQRKTCIKFACPSEPVRGPSSKHEQARAVAPGISGVGKAKREGSPATLRKRRSSSIGRSPRSLTPRRRPSHSSLAIKSKKYLTAESTDLNGESSRFHEFACDEYQEDDWIRQTLPSMQRLTINDTLRKENEIRRIGQEAEDEALQEEFADDEPENEDDGDQDVDEDDMDGADVDDAENDLSGYDTDDDVSAGYNTDNEIGFADSDGDDDDADELELWTHGQAATLQFSGATPIARRPSLVGNRSDSSSSSEANTSRRPTSREKTRRIRIRPGTPELPDSTDFVCGTLDEDRPIEDAYISCIAQKRREKMHLIPQDIDPSFPTSEPEDDDEDDKGRHDSDEHVWIHGELEDLNNESERVDRRKKKSNHNSPKRYHSPPPKRHHSPAPKGRGRSPPPRKLFDRQSPKRLMSPPPMKRVAKSPPATPTQNAVHGAIDFQALASRPGLTHTKSLPKPPALFPHRFKGQRSRHAAYTGAKGHVRGAIDIVKGLEHKRQRRREKYIQKHCNRARKGQAVEKRPEPGKGAQRMRELGLHMAGKQANTIHVLSI